jgi:GT2 family glycosyltransferase
MFSQTDDGTPGGAAAYGAFCLGRNTVVLVRDLPHRAKILSPALGPNGRPLSPAASMKLSRIDGGTRVLRILNRAPTGELEARLEDGQVLPSVEIAIPAEAELPAPTPERLLDGLETGAAVSLVSALLGTWASTFGLADSRAFLRLCRALLGHLAPRPSAASVVAYAVDDIVLVETTVPAEMREVDAVYHLAEGQLARMAARPFVTDRAEGPVRRVHVVADGAPTPREEDLVVVIGPSGVCVRVVDRSRRGSPPLVRWLAESPAAYPRLRENLIIELSRLSEAGRAYALETQVLAPVAPLRAEGQGAMPEAEINLALAGKAGILVGGWYRDPAALMRAVEILRPDGRPFDLLPTARAFPGEVERNGQARAVTGFACLAPPVEGHVQLLQPRFRIALRSGAHQLLVPPVQTVDPVEARAIALRAVPLAHADERVIADVLSPVIADLHGQVMSRPGEPIDIVLGALPEQRRVSLVVPLYKVLDFLRFQFASFATDPWIRANAELIYVLDSPEQASQVEHILAGLHLLYGMPVRLRIMPRNGGYARACNAGAAVARGAVLAMLNSDVIPTGRGWLEALDNTLSRVRGCGAVGPKLLFEDGSIQHAGMFFAPDFRGRWLNHHFHKGLPRQYAPARVEREVPAVTGACLVLPAELFREVGGFTEDYVIGDFEDSDLCLKLRAAGRSIHYVPRAELYHFERRSISQSGDYMRGVACLYNGWLHQRRWLDLMASLPSGTDVTAALLAPLPTEDAA